MCLLELVEFGSGGLRAAEQLRAQLLHFREGAAFGRLQVFGRTRRVLVGATLKLSQLQSNKCKLGLYNEKESRMKKACVETRTSFSSPSIFRWRSCVPRASASLCCARRASRRSAHARRSASRSRSPWRAASAARRAPSRAPPRAAPTAPCARAPAAPSAPRAPSAAAPPTASSGPSRTTHTNRKYTRTQVRAFYRTVY